MHTELILSFRQQSFKMSLWKKNPCSDHHDADPWTPLRLRVLPGDPRPPGGRLHPRGRQRPAAGRRAAGRRAEAEGERRRGSVEAVSQGGGLGRQQEEERRQLQRRGPGRLQAAPHPGRHGYLLSEQLSAQICLVQIFQAV